MLDPFQAGGSPVDGNEVRPAIAVDVEHLMRVPIGPSADDFDFAEKAFLPGRRLIPVTAADNIELAVLVDIEDGGGHEFRVGVDDVPPKRDVIRKGPCGDKKSDRETHAATKHGLLLTFLKRRARKERRESPEKLSATSACSAFQI